ncbi:ABC transporter substrate-binding protein [Neobacillus sp. OS1-32]|uniref:ABC transporter substrate-binding protein n=1 Tax=Neobacillus sp. OS1-32 TaxID=3070682 RepID=UPI0027E196F9|nr:ABC transporter substrate-binding protein [Neobacillus sp. OS1-32]WML31750.1 ABC transporter substrate-binding protein [Neobacillus sp. OS1-32]
MKRRWIITVSFLISILMLSACNSSKETSSNGKKSDIVKIAGIFSSSGGAAPLGEPELETLKMLVNNQNKEGGIDGKKIELITYDDKSDQNEAVLAMKKAVTRDKVSAVIGGTISGNALAMLPLAEQNKVPFFAVASSYQIYQKDDGSSREWIYKVAPDDRHAVEKLLQYLKSKGIKKVAWLNVANSFGTGAHTEFKKMAPDYGVEPVIEDEFEVTVKDAKPMLTRVKKANPEAIIVWGTVQESSVVIKNIHELGIELPILGSHAIGSEQLIALAGDVANDVVFPGGKLLVADQLKDSDPQKELLLKYIKMYEEKYNKGVSLYGAHVWDSFYMLVKAVEAKGADPKVIRDYVENDLGEYVGLYGIFNINKKNHNGLTADTSLVMIRIKEGKWAFEE